MLSLILISIYFMVSYVKKNSRYDYEYAKRNSNYNILLILLSGIFLGLAIFTKLPAFSIIPLMGFLFYYAKSHLDPGKCLGCGLLLLFLYP